jgi:hypothetical protein
VTVLGLYNAGDILTVVSYDGGVSWPSGCVKVLKDFIDHELRTEFEARGYTGPSWEFSDHYYNFLLECGYIEVFPTDGTLYL